MTPKFTVKVRQENSLLSILLDREITEVQARLIAKMLQATDIAGGTSIENLEYNFDLALEDPKEAGRRTDEDHTGAGDSVEAYRG